MAGTRIRVKSVVFGRGVVPSRPPRPVTHPRTAGPNLTEEEAKAKKDPSQRKSVDLTVQVWREGRAIYVAGGELDPITVSSDPKSESYLPGMWAQLDKVLTAQGK